MSIIKEISDEIKDVAKNKVAILKIRKALTLLSCQRRFLVRMKYFSVMVQP